MGSGTGELIAALFVFILVFLAIRAFWLWYWKVDEQVALLKNIHAELQQLNGKGSLALSPATSTPPETGASVITPAAPLVPPEEGEKWTLPCDVTLRRDSPVPDISLEPRGTVPEGTVVEVVARRPGWVNVRLPSRRVGWIATG